MQKKYPKLMLIQGKKEGLGKAYIRGFEYIFNHVKSDIVFEMDADGQHDPHLLPSFFKEIDNGADFVIGSRYIKGGSIPDEWEIHRKFFSYFGNNLVLRFGFMEFSVTDWTSGYRAIRVPFIQKTIDHFKNLDGYTFQIGIVDQALKNELVIKEIPLVFKDRKVGASKIQTFKFVIDNLKYILFHSSFVKFVIVGLSGALLDFGIAAFLINSFHLFKPHANAISAEIAIICNFVLNNFWSFSYKQIESTTSSFVKKFIEFNIVSSGSILIQWAGMLITLALLGDKTIRILFLEIPSWILYKIFIIAFIIIPYSYFMYNRFVWKKEKKTK
jgi:dolichol-phosphate mannosyltransferase